MLSLTSRAIVLPLARPASQSACFSSVPSAAPRAKRHDPALEQRRAARLAKETSRAKQSEAAARGIARNRNKSNNDMMSATTAVLDGSPRPKSRPRKPSKRDQTRPSQSRRGTESSRLEASKPGAAEAIMAFSEREAANRAAAEATKPRAPSQDGELNSPIIVDPPQFTAPEPISSNLAATLNTVPNLVSSLPTLPAVQKLRKAPAVWAKGVYGGDYSRYQLGTQDYLKGARGPSSVYAKIVLGRNPTIPLGSQQQLIGLIQKVTREPRTHA